MNPTANTPTIQYYKVITMFVTTSGPYRWSPCNCVDFYNQGTSDVYINGRRVQPNAGFGFTGFPGELDETTYNISFDGEDPNANVLAVTTKEYINYGAR